ncbi:MAG: hypothetical protein ACTSV2_11020 [Candidatus Thorarchaeota archaeon]
MKMFKHNPIDTSTLNAFFTKRIQRSGIFKRQDLETLVVHKPIWKPFRVVKFALKSMINDQPTTCVSLVDEMLMPYTDNRNDMILLWRPKYIEIDTIEIPGSVNSEPSGEEDENLIQSISEFVFQRTESQFELIEIDQELNKSYRRDSSSMTLIMPRFLSMRKRERELVMDKESVKVFLIASSIVTNSQQGYYITDFELQERMWVQTFLAEFRNIESGDRRLVFLENTGENLLEKSLLFGKTLTILCERNLKSNNQMASAFNI